MRLRVRVRGSGGSGGEWCWVGRWVGEYVLVRVCVVLVYVSVVLVFVSLCVLILKIAENEQVHQVKRMIGGLGSELFSIYSQTSNG